LGWVRKPKAILLSYSKLALLEGLGLIWGLIIIFRKEGWGF